MRRRNTESAMAVFALVALCSVASAQTIRIGAAAGIRGQTVSVPVTLTATTSHTAALVRVQYNAAALENVSAAPGALLSPGHALDSNAPAAGRFDVALYAPSGMPSFTAKSGTLLNLTFRIKATAFQGTYPITFTTVGTPALPSADLVGITGAAVTPTAITGSVRVGGTAAEKSWRLYE